MATSPNFSWPEPDNTDLVKNGALAIRTAVDAIDSSMADLKGGTTGQVLSKNSNTDMDFTWVAQDDSNAIQNAIVDAKGDLIAATAADTPARLAVGTNGQVLTADSTAATGLAWATPSAGSTYVAGKNFVINGAMDIWQRGASGLGTSTGSYTADRWVLGSSSTTVTRDTDVPTSPYFQYSLKMVGTAANSIITRLESAISTPLAGQTITFSFYAKRTSGTGNLDVRFYYANSTDNFAAVTQIGSTVVVAASPSSSWTRYSVTAAIGTNVTTGLQILINNDAGSGSTTFITGAQLEIASSASAFSRNASTIALELAACQRYYNNVGTVGHVAYSSVGVMGFVFPVTMRTTPTASFSYSGVANRFYNIQTGATSDLVSPTVIVSNTGVQNLYAFTPSSWAVAAGTGFHTQWTLSAEL